VAGTPLKNQIESVTRRLASTFDLPADAIEPEVRAAFEEWDHARVRDFVPIFVERELRSRRRRASTNGVR
jgi:hypothetical protein